MRVCVIGGSGFIGSRYVLRANGKREVQILDKQQSVDFPDDWIHCDIREQESLTERLKGHECVLHLAAEHRDNVSPISLYYDVNVQGTKNILEAMNVNEINNIVFMSSVAIYGLDKVNPSENHPPDPFNDYGKSKWQAEELLREWYHQRPNARNLTIIRPTVVFGENNRGNVYNLLKQLASGKFMMVGDGTNKKSMAYVDNVAAFIDHCSNRLKGYQVYNYVDKPDINMRELVLQVAKSMGRNTPAARLPYWLGMLGGYGFDLLSLVTGRKFPVSSVRVRKFCATTQFDSTLAHSSGFEAPYSLSEGLDRTLKHDFQ